MLNSYRRFYSHYSFIYPDLYLKNVVVELNNEGRIDSIFPFEKEIENTEFYSGKIYFLVAEMAVKDYIDISMDNYKTIESPIRYSDSMVRIVYDEKGLKL